MLSAEAYPADSRGCYAVVDTAGGHWPDATDMGERFITGKVIGNWNLLEAARGPGFRT